MADTTGSSQSSQYTTMEELAPLIAKQDQDIQTRFSDGIPLSTGLKAPAGFDKGEAWHAGVKPIYVIQYEDTVLGSTHYWSAKVDSGSEAENILKSRLVSTGRLWADYNVLSMRTLEDVYETLRSETEAKGNPEEAGLLTNLTDAVQYLRDRKVGHTGDYAPPNYSSPGESTNNAVDDSTSDLPPLDGGSLTDGTGNAIVDSTGSVITDPFLIEAVVVHQELLEAVSVKMDRDAHMKAGSARYPFAGPWAFFWEDEILRIEGWAFNAIYDGDYDQGISTAHFNADLFNRKLDQLLKLGAYRAHIYFETFGRDGNEVFEPLVVDTDGDGVISQQEAESPSGTTTIITLNSTSGVLPDYSANDQFENALSKEYGQALLNPPVSVATDEILDLIRDGLVEEPVRARNANGTFTPDNPSTEINEAWTDGVGPQ